MGHEKLGNRKQSLDEMTAASLRSLGFDDPQRMRELEAFLEVDEDTCGKIKEVKAVLDPYVVRILDDIYDHLQQFPDTAKLLPNAAEIKRLKDAQRGYFNQLMSGQYDLEYVKGVVRVGLAHVRVNLEPEWYMGTYSKYLCSVIASLFEAREGDASSDQEMLASIQTLVKIFFFDMTLTIKSYIGPLMAELNAKKRDAMEEAQGLHDLTGRIVASVNENAERVQMMAASIEEMSAATREISKNIQSSTQITAEAVEKTARVTKNIDHLKTSTENIGKMTKGIQSIAEQTNLLALNATIESARAGEAGRGFAVVAKEVKELSKATATATEEITGMILEVQRETRAAVDAISELRATIQEINGIITSIAGAVEEQSVTTDEMSQSTTCTSDRMAQIAEDIRSVEESNTQPGESD
ncbi:MAG: protoglobin domain-containing protein [Nitrospiria bacterium]